MDTAYNVPSMALYLVFFSCLATIAMATRCFNSLYAEENVKITETRPRKIGFVLRGHCQILSWVTLVQPLKIAAYYIGMFA